MSVSWTLIRNLCLSSVAMIPRQAVLGRALASVSHHWNSAALVLTLPLTNVWPWVGPLMLVPVYSSKKGERRPGWALSPFQFCGFIILTNESQKSQKHPNYSNQEKKHTCDSVLYGVKDSLLTFESLNDSICVPLKLHQIPVNYFLKLIWGQYGILCLIIWLSDSEL